jgi:parallel beta-helix repeat protein
MRFFLLATSLWLVIAADPAAAADCGDKAGPGRSDVPCSCGDSLVTSTRLTVEDPVVFTGGGDTGCPGNGLFIATDGVRLDCDGRLLNGNGAGGVGIGIRVVASRVSIQRCSVQNFSYGVLASDGTRLKLSRSQLLQNRFGVALMCDQSSLSGNIVSNNEVAGIYLDVGYQRISVRKNALSNNEVLDIDNAGAAGANRFKGNTCDSSQGPDVDCP